MNGSVPISFADYFDISNLAYEWADAYDAKDWARLETLVGPAIRLNFRYLQGPLYEDLSPAQYVAKIADRKILGDRRVKTQHLLGGGQWSVESNGTIQVWWQVRAAHQRSAAEDGTEAISTAHGHGANRHTYQKIGNTWRIVGFQARVDWVEGDVLHTITPPEES